MAQVELIGIFIPCYKNTNVSQFCVAILDKRGLDHNMTQFITKEQAALQLALCYDLFKRPCMVIISS